MINRVTLAGKLLRAPQPLRGGRRGSELELLLEHVPHWSGGPVEQCPVRVWVLGERQAETVERWLDAGRAISLQGHLVRVGAELVVEAESWQFLPDELVSRCLWEGAGVGDPRQEPGRVQPVEPPPTERPPAPPSVPPAPEVPPAPLAPRGAPAEEPPAPRPGRRKKARPAPAELPF